MGSKLRKLRQQAGVSGRPARRGGAGAAVVYGAGCCWWDSIDKAGTTASGLPCCPHCGSMLFETTETDWWSGAAREEEHQRGYVSLLQWSRGRCFKTWSDARAACRAEQAALCGEGGAP